MNTSSTTTRKFTLIVLSVYFGTLALIILSSALSGKFDVDGVGNALLYVGVAIFILGFLSRGATLRGIGGPRSIHSRSDKEFMEWRKQQRPVELITSAVILAATLLALTGYFLLRLISSA
jgi:hypothetical protein